MTTATQTLTAWLLDQIAADEAAAQAVSAHERSKWPQVCDTIAERHNVDAARPRPAP